MMPRVFRLARLCASKCFATQCRFFFVIGATSAAALGTLLGSLGRS
jgi:hypothetical protein